MKRVVEEVKKDIDKKQTYLKVPINDGPNPPKKQNDDKIIQMLEDMCVYGNIEKMQLKAEKEKHPEKYKYSRCFKNGTTRPRIICLRVIIINFRIE